jgi:hypothetical protein
LHHLTQNPKTQFTPQDDGDAEAKKPDFTDSVRDAASAVGQNIIDVASTGVDKGKEIWNDTVSRVTGSATTVSMVAAVGIGAALLA